MEETALRNLALICTATGLILLFIASSQMQAVTDAGAITIDDTGKAFRVCGNITSMAVRNSHIFLDIEDSTGSIRFVMFNTTALKLNETGSSPYELRAGIRICAPGIADEYPKGSGSIELVYRGGDIVIA